MFFLCMAQRSPSIRLVHPALWLSYWLADPCCRGSRHDTLLSALQVFTVCIIIHLFIQRICVAKHLMTMPMVSAAEMDVPVWSSDFQTQLTWVWLWVMP